MNVDELSALLAAGRPALERFVARHARTLALHEPVEDLVQGVITRALGRAGDFELRSGPEFEAWMLRVARAHIADRRAHFAAAKRRPARLLRLTRADSDTDDPAAVREPASPGAGPATRAERADQVRRAEEALALLLPRDAELVVGHAEGRTLDEEAARLGIAYDAAQRARHRALERYRRAFELLSRRAARGS